MPEIGPFVSIFTLLSLLASLSERYWIQDQTERMREMEWRSSWTDPFQEYLKPFACLIGDRRTWHALLETVKGIIASGSVIGTRIAASSEELSRSKNGAQRVLRMAKGESTRRSELDAEHLTARLRQVGE